MSWQSGSDADDGSRRRGKRTDDAAELGGGESSGQGPLPQGDGPPPVAQPGDKETEQVQQTVPSQQAEPAQQTVSVPAPPETGASAGAIGA